MKKVKVLVAQPCLTLCDPMDCSPPGSSVHGILQTRILGWVPFSFSRGSSQSRDQIQVSRIAGGFSTSWATRETQEYWSGQPISSPGDLPKPRFKPRLPALQVNSLLSKPPGKTKVICVIIFCLKNFCLSILFETHYNGGERGWGSQRQRVKPTFPTELWNIYEEACDKIPWTKISTEVSTKWYKAQL